MQFAVCTLGIGLLTIILDLQGTNLTGASTELVDFTQVYPLILH